MGFDRRVGMFGGHHVSPHGRVLDQPAWEASRDRWLPTAGDKARVQALMRPVHEPGKIAAWVAPPRNGINGRPFDYEYVHL
ncbi:hypothetical protein [Nonomuraea jabiensis]|uniref:hypothetical protein n=1 Tax=Nonomuraea jabiensis TaxID=882448 RepID=UPI00368C5458